MFRRALHHARTSRHRRLAPLGLSLALIAAPLALLTVPAGAALSGGSPFNAANGSKDSNAGPALLDESSGQFDNSYVQGAKEDDLCPTVEAGSIPDNKADLTKFYVATGRGTTDTFLYLAWERASTSGTVTLDFELNKSSVIKSVAQGCNGVNPNRSVGDKLITYDLQGNKDAETVVISVRSWNGTAWGAESVLNSATAEGSISESLLFGEMAINLEAAGIFQRNVCENFALAMVKSRSSNAFDAAMKDFIKPYASPVSNCGQIDIEKVDDAEPASLLEGAEFTLYTDGGNEPGVAVTPAQSCTTGSDGTCSIKNIWPGTYWVVETTTPPGYDTADPMEVVVAVGANTPAGVLTFVDERQPATLIIEKEDDLGAVLAGAEFTLYTDGGTEPGDPVAGYSCTTGNDGKCTIDDILPAGTYWVVETDVPDGYDKADPQEVTLGLGQEVTLTFVDARQPASVTIVKKDDAGAALAGATFGLYSDDEGEIGDAVEGKACTTGSDGTCTIDGILPPGTYWLHETVVPAGYEAAPDQKVTLSLNEDVVLPTFVDNRIPATVNIVKQDGAGAALAGAGFGLYTDNDGAIGSAVAGASCTTNASGLCSIGGILPPGTYWVHETVVPVGHKAAPDQKVTLDLADTVTLTFVDPILGPAIDVEKTGPAAVHVGDPVVYTFTVTNPGETDLSSVVVSDPKCDATPVRETVDADDVLSPGETWIYHCTHVATVAEGQSILNTVSVTGTGPLGNTVSDEASHTTAVLHPAISIVKTANPESVSGSGPVTYTYVVTNSGDTALFDVTVTDDIIGAIGSVGELAAGESVTMTKTVQVDTSTPPRNIGTAVGTDILGQTVLATDDAVITVVLAAAAELPRTGAPLHAQTRAALALIEVGIFMILSGRRRRGGRWAD